VFSVLSYWQSRNCCSLLPSWLETSKTSSGVKKWSDLGKTLRNWKEIHDEITRWMHYGNAYIFVRNLLLSCRIWGFLSSGYEELYLVHIKLSSLERTFRRNMSPQFQGWTVSQIRKRHEADILSTSQNSIRNISGRICQPRIQGRKKTARRR
jgi:hypothetical protein